MEELDCMNELYDPQKYIETGFKLYSWKVIHERGCYDQNWKSKSLSVSSFRNLVIERHDLQDFRIYRKFTHADVHEYKPE